MKLSHRISFVSTFFLLLLLIIVNTSIYYIFESYTTKAELDRTVASTHAIVESIQLEDVENTNPNEFLRAFVPNDGMLRIINEQDQTVVSLTKQIPLNNIATQYAIKDEIKKIEFQGNHYAVARTPMIWVDGSIVTLEINEPMVIYEETVSRLQYILVIASLFIIVPSFFAGQALSRFILLPIKALVQTMNDIQQSGEFKKIEVNKTSKDELDEMGISFNHMMDLLKENFEKQQQFVSDASHELKTPLTVIESYAKLLKRWGMKKTDVLEEAVHAIHSEAQRMKDMTNQMLALATGENETNINLKQINLNILAEETANRLATAYQRNIFVYKEKNVPSFIGDEGKIKQLLFILLENSLKYSDKEVEVYISAIKDKVELSVSDFGVGIPKSDVPHIFERFFRVDKARSRKTGGSGLGLSIAKSIVDAHKGTITVESEEGKGTTFIVVFPRGEGE
ncbi:ATP-binding protein [Alkalihalobacillus sp. LMS39]|uniref:sensor histidine kinase n=1 Tax=Alkalihalobacillus sp. LMS39 TaxID=2924032 RepID=UPI001FB1B8BF|nr:ATP-binding protein [Alkalihalobacillus sp. LMS39]UOE92105.1 HAMP domain-containing histidine kinase [Alkalihalobacillus sp. LMS39]